MQDALGYKVKCFNVRVSRTGHTSSIADNATLSSCGIVDRDTIMLERTSPSCLTSTSSSAAAAPKSAHASQKRPIVDKDSTSTSAPRESRPFVEAIARSGARPTVPLEAAALASHAVILQMGFVCIRERTSNDLGAVSGFAPPLSGPLE